MILTPQHLTLIRSRRLWANPHRLREWISDLLETVEDAGTQLTTARAEIAKLELEVSGWRSAADRAVAQGKAVGVGEQVYPKAEEWVRPKYLLVNSERSDCLCHGVGCNQCCGVQ